MALLSRAIGGTASAYAAVAPSRTKSIILSQQYHAAICVIFKLCLILTILTTLIGPINAIRLPRPLSPRDDTVTSITGQASTTAASGPVPVASASSIAASVAAQQSQLATVPAIPLPPNITNYDQLSRLVALMPHRLAVTPEISETSESRRSAIKRKNTEPLGETSLSPNGTQHQSSDYGSLTGRATPLRVMIVGDSMTQGQQGDYTWRYRISEWFSDMGIAVTFVGPYIGTQPPSDPEPPTAPALYGAPAAASGPVRDSGLYATAFQSNHFSVWGRAAATDKSLIHDILVDNYADMMLLMLGFNDIGWFYSDSPGTLDSIKTIVDQSRAVNPNMKFAIANIPMRTDLGRVDLPANTDIYNGLLKNAIPQWTTTQSPIGLVELRENYSCELESCPAGYDGLHPNAYGEYEIAYAFSLTLANGFGMGTRPVIVPDYDTVPARPAILSVPANFNVQTSPGGILATWDPVFGAYGYDVQSRIEGATDWEIGSVGTNRYDGTWTQDGWVYDIQIRVSCGNYQKGPWTSIGTATAHPQTAAGPSNVVVTSTATGFSLTFDPPTGPYTDTISEYTIWYFDKDTECSWLETASFTGSPVHIDGLLPGHRYLVAPTTWNAAGGGFPEVVNSVTIGEGTPAAPSGLQLFAIDLTTLHMTWTGSGTDAGYNLYSRNVNDGSARIKAGSSDLNCVDDYFLFPGIWNFEFCVSAYNGNAESGLSNCVVIPSPAAGFVPAATCAAAPPHCPAGAGWAQGSPAPTSRQTTGPTGTLIGGAGGGGAGTVTTITTTGSGGQSTTFVATIVPTTATDSAGHTVTGTITEGPSPTATTNTALTTYSGFPPGFSASSTSVTTNTHDSSGHPVLGPWPLCWFCPPGSNGWVLWGIGPGVYPGGGPPAGFPTPFPTFTIEPNGDPEYTSSSSTECETATVTDVTYWVEVDVDGSGSITATSTYSTDSSMITACSATAYTTTEYSTSSLQYCSIGCDECSVSLDARDVAPTAISVAQDRNTSELIELGSIIPLLERDIESMSASNNKWKNFYNIVKNFDKNTNKLTSANKPTTSPSDAIYVEFDDAAHNLYLEGLEGCTSIVVVNRQGAYINHIWEWPHFINTVDSTGWDTQIIAWLQGTNTGQLAALAQPGGIFGDRSNLKIFLMTVAARSLDIETDDATTLNQGTNPMEYPAKIAQITSVLNGIFPNIDVGTFVYRRQTEKDILKDNPYGRAMILYSNNQVKDPANLAQPLPNPQKAVYQVYMQSQLMDQAIWDFGNPTFPQVNFCVEKTVGSIPDGIVLNTLYQWYEAGSGVTCFSPSGTEYEGTAVASTADGDSTYHFPTSSVAMGTIMGRSGCNFWAKPIIDSDDAYGSAASGETVGTIQCTPLPGDATLNPRGGGGDSGIVVVAYCTKAYASATDSDETLHELLFNCVPSIGP